MEDLDLLTPCSMIPFPRVPSKQQRLCNSLARPQVIKDILSSFRSTVPTHNRVVWFISLNKQVKIICAKCLLSLLFKHRCQFIWFLSLKTQCDDSQESHEFQTQFFLLFVLISVSFAAVSAGTALAWTSPIDTQLNENTTLSITVDQSEYKAIDFISRRLPITSVSISSQQITLWSKTTLFNITFRFNSLWNNQSGQTMFRCCWLTT